MKKWLGKVLCYFGIHNLEYTKEIASKYGDFVPAHGQKICKRCKMVYNYTIDRS